ncbi:MAG: thioredoxin [Bacteroidales bacterium]
MNSFKIRKSAQLLFIFLIVLSSISCNRSGGSDENILTLTSDNFDQTISKGVVLVDFWATWCKPCKLQGPIVAEIATEYKGKLIVGKIDIDQNQNLATSYNIQSIPTLIIFVEGKEVETFVGLQSKSALQEILNKYVKQ